MPEMDDAPRQRLDHVRLPRGGEIGTVSPQAYRRRVIVTPGQLPRRAEPLERGSDPRHYRHANMANGSGRAAVRASTVSTGKNVSARRTFLAGGPAYKERSARVPDAPTLETRTKISPTTAAKRNAGVDDRVPACARPSAGCTSPGCTTVNGETSRCALTRSDRLHVLQRRQHPHRERHRAQRHHHELRLGVRGRPRRAAHHHAQGPRHQQRFGSDCRASPSMSRTSERPAEQREDDPVTKPQDAPARIVVRLAACLRHTRRLHVPQPADHDDLWAPAEVLDGGDLRP
jgi:hypothetical protein